MRIIAGKFKGRTLETLRGNSVRPTTDRVKESIFNLIQFRVDDARVLDLFCGSGALGIESLSRGASQVTFCDKARASIEITKKNLEKVHGNISIINKDYSACIDTLAREGKKFDIIFLDPPYLEGLQDAILNKLKEADILDEDGVIVYERAREVEGAHLPSGFVLTDSRDYGATTVDLIEYGNAVAVTGTFDPFTTGHEFLVDKALESFKSVHVVILDNPEKNCLFPLDKRLKFIKNALKRKDGRIVIDYYNGLAIDYCKKNDIQYIIRGVRNSQDATYEQEMAEWNMSNGNVTTLFIDAQDKEISSTAVRDAIMNGEDITGLVHDINKKEIISEGYKW